ncbi:MAG: hypothetical protein HOE72_05295 [Candidatus Marinimicrobia bacterium]|jgi:ammonia channel protein AmtB|nr:hypothetical protein [Candidatus Neomarinimicrobiota bacterium]|tara:strand:- start:1034 stop:1390 length:357 start_codon:yes stop_codon:yes gene_type:complete
MKIINKIREWNILVKILLFLISLPLIWFIEDFIGGMIVFIMFYIGGVPVKPNLMGFLLLVEIIVVIISWILFGYSLFKTKEVRWKDNYKNRCNKCLAIQTKKDFEKGQCWKCDESLEK